MRSKQLRKFGVSAVIALVVVGNLLYYSGALLKPREVSVGMTQAEVLQLAGQPASKVLRAEADSILEQHGKPELAGRSVENKSVVFIYRSGIDWERHVFFDEDGRVYLVNEGGT